MEDSSALYYPDLSYTDLVTTSPLEAIKLGLHVGLELVALLLPLPL